MTTAQINAWKMMLAVSERDGDHAEMKRLQVLIGNAEEDQREADHLRAVAADMDAAVSEAVEWLDDNVSASDWDRLVGQQGRSEFAELTIQNGQDIEAGWASYVEHIEGQR